MKTSVAVGNMLAVWQKKHGYNNDEVARNLGVTKSTVVCWKSGRSIPTLHALINMKRKGVGIEGIPGVPSSALTVSVVRNFCNINSVTIRDLCDNVKISVSTLYKFINGNDVKNVEGLYRVEKYIENYNSPSTNNGSDVEQEQNILEEQTMSGKWTTVLTRPNASEIDIDDDVTDQDDMQENDDQIRETFTTEVEERDGDVNSSVDNEISGAVKKITLRSVLAFAEKYNVLDAEMMTDGGFSVYGFKLIIEEDGNIRFRLKTR